MRRRQSRASCTTHTGQSVHLLLPLRYSSMRQFGQQLFYAQFFLILTWPQNGTASGNRALAGQFQSHSRWQSRFKSQRKLVRHCCSAPRWSCLVSTGAFIGPVLGGHDKVSCLFKSELATWTTFSFQIVLEITFFFFFSSHLYIFTSFSAFQLFSNILEHFWIPQIF